MSFFKNLLGTRDTPKNPKLEQAMNEVAKNDNAKTRESLYKSILASTFILEGNVSGGTEVGGKRIADAGTRVAFKTIEHPSGNVILPVFTDVDALASFAGANAQWIALGAQALFQSIAPGDIAEVRVNPFRIGQAMKRPGGIITRNEFMALAQGLLPEPMISNNAAPLKVAAGQKLLIGKPAKQPPAELLSILTNYFQQLPELQGAYLFQMTNQSVMSTVICLRFADAPNVQRMEEIMRGVGELTKAQIPAGMYLDFMPLKAGSFFDSVQKIGQELFRK